MMGFGFTERCFAQEKRDFVDRTGIQARGGDCPAKDADLSSPIGLCPVTVGPDVDGLAGSDRHAEGRQCW